MTTAIQSLIAQNRARINELLLLFNLCDSFKIVGSFNDKPGYTKEVSFEPHLYDTAKLLQFLQVLAEFYHVQNLILQMGPDDPGNYTNDFSVQAIFSDTNREG